MYTLGDRKFLQPRAEEGGRWGTQTCSVCHERYLSLYWRRGGCADCGSPVCARCWRAGHRRCAEHGSSSILARPVLPGNTESQDRPQGPGGICGEMMFPSDSNRVPAAAPTGQAADCMEAILQEPTLRYPLSARKLAEEHNWPWHAVVKAFRQLAEQRCNVILCDDPQRQDCLLDLA